MSVPERTPGEEAGVKSVELVVEGRLAYGYLKGARAAAGRHPHAYSQLCVPLCALRAS